MITTALQGLSMKRFQSLRRLMARVGAWIRTQPRLALWVFPAPETADARYREFNERCFADLYEQERMLADKPRMNFYNCAIARHIQPGDRVIDLGTGTGVLAALASAQRYHECGFRSDAQHGVLARRESRCDRARADGRLPV